MKIERLSVHLPLAPSPESSTEQPNADATINVFHRMIRENLVADELLLDVVDYRHVPDGPGVLLVADESITSLGRAGLTVDNRREPSANVETEIVRVVSRVIERALFLERAPEFGGSLHFDSAGIGISVRDRLAQPNAASFEKWIRATLEPVAGALDVSQSERDQRGPVRLNVRFLQPSGSLERLWGRIHPS